MNKSCKQSRYGEARSSKTITMGCANPHCLLQFVRMGYHSNVFSQVEFVATVRKILERPSPLQSFLSQFCLWRHSVTNAKITEMDMGRSIATHSEDITAIHHRSLFPSTSNESVRHGFTGELRRSSTKSVSIFELINVDGKGHDGDQCSLGNEPSHHDLTI
jgi:hypothetical protein